uniref:Coagulation factor IXa heavy chain n=1 Tax=Salarias fasciatus TaxID=181472 RepID=A0A672GMH7_SALFA
GQAVLLVLSVLCVPSVFLEPPVAGQILRSSSRWRRANSGLEEMFPGDLERECYEERCSQEEAAEIFHSQEKTLEFWFRYISLNPCETNPCLNRGICTMDRGDFTCLCLPKYRGKTCESEVLECVYKNGGCQQYCRDLPGGAGVQCDCADGYKLEADGRSCSAAVAFPCGVQQEEWRFRRFEWVNVTMETDYNSTGMTELTANTSWERGPPQDLGGGSWEPRIVGGHLERRGGSPWQVLVRRSDGFGFCGGALVSDRWVISAAHCFQEGAADHVTIGDLDKKRPDEDEQLIKIQKIILHPHFHSFTFDSDIALLFLARPALRGPTATPVCLPDTHLSSYLLRDQNYGVVTGWGSTHYLRRSSRFLRRVSVPVVSHSDCTSSTEQVITDNMFCAGFLDGTKDSCSGDSGGPFVVNYRETWFLTGVVSWGEKCAAKGKYGVYTRLGNFLTWIRDTMTHEEQLEAQDPMNNQHLSGTERPVLTVTQDPVNNQDLSGTERPALMVTQDPVNNQDLSGTDSPVQTVTQDPINNQDLMGTETPVLMVTQDLMKNRDVTGTRRLDLVGTES